MPSNCGLINKEEMTYVEGGKRYYYRIGLFSLILGFGGGSTAVIVNMCL